MRIFISAGEASGDLHAAAVVRALRQGVEPVQVHGIAGPAMQAAGCGVVVSMRELQAMGISDVLCALPRIRRARSRLLSWAAEHRPDVAILVDYPGFHMHVGKRLRGMGIPVLHYIAPKLWAWGAWRVRHLRRSQDRLACIFPFEPAWFRARDIDARYVGNPTAVRCRSGWSRSRLCAIAGLDATRPVLALLPGSRPGELREHMPLLAGVQARVLRDFPDCQVIVPRPAGIDETEYAALTGQGAVLVDRMAEGFALRVDAAVAVSGTVTLELALWGVPTVLVYRSSWLTVFLARRLVRIRCAGLANILLGDRPVMPELIQESCTPEAVMRELIPLLGKGAPARRQRQAFAELAGVLGSGEPAPAVARMALDLAGER